MANRILISSKNIATLLTNNLQKHLRLSLIPPPRFLYVPATLGLDGFVEQRNQVQQQMTSLAEKFKEKMNSYTTDDSKNMIFTEDLKNMIYIAQNEQDVDLVVKMIKKFNQQNKSLRFGNFVFGPVVMRLFHLLNKPDVAVECFKSPELAGFFDQLMSYQILLDLLYENGKYNEILELYKVIADRQIETAKFPKNVVVLALAACYKLNTKESLEWALNLWKQFGEAGHFPMRRAITFCAGLALNQGKPEIALEIVSAAKNANYTTVRNIKAAALAELGRPDDAIPVLKSIITDDRPDDVPHTFNKDVIEKVKKAVSNCDSLDTKTEFERLLKLFESEGHISDKTLDEQLCAVIKKPPPLKLQGRQQQQNRFQYQSQNRSSFRPRQRYDNSGRDTFSRPGLKDLI